MTGSDVHTAPKLPAVSPDQNDADNLEILWRWITVPLFLYCAGLWLRSQSGSYEVLAFISKDHDVVTASGLFAAPIAFVSLWLAARYAHVCATRPRIERVPRIVKRVPVHLGAFT